MTSKQMTVLISAKLSICSIARSSWDETLSNQTDTMLVVLHTIQAGCTPYYSGWLESNHDGLGQPGLTRGHRIIDERAEAQVKYNQLRKRIQECESEHREIQEANQKLTEEWKDMDVSANK